MPYLPPNHQTICLGNAGGPTHPRDADDPALFDGTFDLLEDLDDRIALPNLRELIAGDSQPLQDSIGLFRGEEAMLWD
jgi:hypothetical protein